MTIPMLAMTGDQPITPVAFAAPTASDTIQCGDNVWLWAKIGATATTITLEDPGRSAPGRVPSVDLVIGPLTSVERVVRIPRRFAKPDGNADVTFSQVTGVTALGLIVSPHHSQ